MMLAARRVTPRAMPATDHQRALVQAYTRMILFPAPNGTRMAVVASFGTRELRLVEEFSTEAPVEDARLKVEVFDRRRACTVASMDCEDLQEAEAATITLLADAGREGGADGRTNTGYGGLAFHPMRVATGCTDEAGLLVLASGKLVAILVQLSCELHGSRAAGSWFIEVGFGSCCPGEERVFPTLDAAEAWIKGRLAGEEVSSAEGR